MNSLKSIILISNPSIKIEETTISSLVDKIADSGCITCILEDNLDLFSYLGNRVKIIKTFDELKNCQAAIVLGGDGSIIEAAHRLIGLKIPIVGINYGHVGFLAEMELSDLTLIDDMLAGKYYIEDRMMLDAAVYSNNGSLKQKFTVLNDIVVSSGSVARLIALDLLCDDVKAQHCRSDGIIIATPTGSTAYSLSAGGPVLEPSLECICLTPICPHTLSSRPSIFSADRVIKIDKIDGRGSTVYLCADGRDTYPLESGDSVVISKSMFRTALIRLKDRAFLHVLATKLSE